jgi:glycosyltransferase involved in cell wall biosynthesis
MIKLVVMIPAYNEEKTIADVIKEIPRKFDAVDEVKVLIIDDGSTDLTVSRAVEAGVDRVLIHKLNMGLGATFKDGLEAAIEMGADIIVNTDADGQYESKEIPALVKPIVEKKADMVLGFRDIDNLSFMPRSKKIGNKIATWVIGKLSALPIIDGQTGFRAFSREAAMRINIIGGYTYTQETIIRASFNGIKIEQVPITFNPRAGKSRLIANIFAYMFRGGLVLMQTYRDYKIAKLAFIIGVALAFAGLVLATIVIVHIMTFGVIAPLSAFAVIAIVLFIFSLQILLTGLSADTYNRQRMLSEEILYLLKKDSGKTHEEIRNK